MMLTCWNCYNLLFCHSLRILCVHPMSMMSTCFRRIFIPSLHWCNPCIFVCLLVSAPSLWSGLLVVIVLLGCNCYIMMLCKPATKSHSMHNLEMLTKDVLLYMSWSSHTCPCLHLWPAVGCRNLALKLLNNVAVSLLTLSSVLAMCFASDPCTLWTCSCHV